MSRGDHRQQRSADRVLFGRRAALRHHHPDDQTGDHRRSGVHPEQQAVAEGREYTGADCRDGEAEVDRPEQEAVRADPLGRLQQVRDRCLNGRAEQVAQQADEEGSHPDQRHRPCGPEQDQRGAGAEEADQHRHAASGPVGQPAADELRADSSGTDGGRDSSRRTGGEVPVVGQVQDEERLHEAAEPVDQLAHPQRPEGPRQCGGRGLADGDCAHGSTVRARRGLVDD